MEMFGAIFRNNKEEVKSLIEKGTEIDPRDEKQRTPLFYTVVDDQPELFDLLIENGADVHLHDGDERTLLHMAAIHQKMWAAKKLLELGVEIDTQDKFGNTPLSEAVYNSKGDGSLITLLLDAGADPEKENNYGVSPVGLADTIANFDAKKFFKKKD